MSGQISKVDTYAMRDRIAKIYTGHPEVRQAEMQRPPGVKFLQYIGLLPVPPTGFLIRHDLEGLTLSHCNDETHQGVLFLIFSKEIYRDYSRS